MCVRLFCLCHSRSFEFVGLAGDGNYPTRQLTMEGIMIYVDLRYGLTNFAISDKGNRKESVYSELL